MKLKMVSAAAETRTTKKTSPHHAPSLVILAATVVLVIAAIAGLITLTLSVISIDSTSSFASQTTMVLGSISSPTLKAYDDPDIFSIGDPNESVLSR